MKPVMLAIGAVTALGLPLQAATLTCEGLGITVDAPTEAVAQTVCEAAEDAVALFSQCNVPSYRTPLAIHVTDALPEGCVGLYHCGEDLIELLDPVTLAERRDSEGPFAFLTVDAYFRSVVVHELAHAAFDTVDCPFDSCITSSEYVAYSMQIMSLTPGQQADFAAQAETGETVSRDHFSIALLFMAPNLFAQRAWTHLQQREDACGYVGMITNGDILLDHGRF